MDIREKVIGLLCDINPKMVEDTKADLLKAGYIDSYEMGNIILELEDIFAIEIDPEDIIPNNFQTVEAIVELIKKSMK